MPPVASGCATGPGRQNHRFGFAGETAAITVPTLCLIKTSLRRPATRFPATEKLNVPDQPVIPFIRGDGTGPDIWAASVRVFDAAVEKAYGGKKKDRVVRSLRGTGGEGQVR